MSGLVQAVEAPAVGDVAPPPYMDSFASSLYASLQPIAWQDGAQGWPLASLCIAIGAMYQEAEDLARDTEDGPGWSMILDLARCPTEWLPWLAQFVGVTIPTGLSDAQMRSWLAGTDGFSRGTPAAMRAAAAATLTSSKTVVFRERITSAYTLEVVTYAAETPDPAATQRALIAQKPAGIVMTYRSQAGADYTAVKAHFATYTALRAAYPTYRDMRDTPLA